MICTSVLGICVERYLVILHAFVLMPTEYHLILSTPLNNLDRMMRFFQTEVARAVLRQSDRINHVFGKRYKWSLLRSSEATAYGYKYAVRSPVRGRYSNSVETYPHSSIEPSQIGAAPWASGTTQLWDLVPKSFAKRLDWLNQPVDPAIENVVARGLRRMEFKLPEGNDHLRKLPILERQYEIPRRAHIPHTRDFSGLKVNEYL